MISKEVKKKKRELLYHSNPKHLGRVHGGELPHWQGKTLNLYVTDYHRFGISLSISGPRGKPYAEIFVDRKHYERFIEQLMIVGVES